MQHFYDAQLKRYLTQFMRIMSNFSYKDNSGKTIQVPVRYGDISRQVAQIANKNSENIIQQAPFIACYIKGIDMAKERRQDPTFIDKVHIRERAFDEQGNEYLNTQGANYTIERLMPVPYDVQFTADIWTTNTDQKLQLLEQLLVLFNPSLDIQVSDNYVDWTSLSVIELSGIQYSSRSIPQGLEQDPDVATLTFKCPIWLTQPAKVKKLGVITKIISSMYVESEGSIAENLDGQVNYVAGRTPTSIQATTFGDFGVLILDNTAKLLMPGDDGNHQTVEWDVILDIYPGKFIAGLSQIRLGKPDGNEIVGSLSLSPTDNRIMNVAWDVDTLPANTLISNPALPAYLRGTIDAIIDPRTFNPLTNVTWPAVDTRYLILDDIQYTADYGPDAWKNQNNTDWNAKANNIIQWDGTTWTTLLDVSVLTNEVYVTNQRTGSQYVWNGSEWVKSYEGVYPAIDWRIVL